MGRAGAVSLKSHQIPYPLPQADGGLCDLEVTSLEWTPGQITGVIASECIAETRQEVALPVYGGHFSQTAPALLDATVTRITGRVNVEAGSHRATASFVAGGETRFRLPVPNEKDDARAGNHGGADGDAERAAAAHVADHPPPGPDRRVYPKGDLPLRRKHDDQDRPDLRPPPGARAGGGNPARPRHPHPPGEHSPRIKYGAGSGDRRGGRRPVQVPLRSPTEAPAAEGGADSGGGFLLVELAVVGRITSILLSSGAALASIAAAPGPEEEQMLAAFDAVLSGMAYAGVGLCLFAIVWAGFVLMAEGAEGEGRGRARNAVLMAVVGLVVVLLAKGIAAALNSELGLLLPVP